MSEPGSPVLPRDDHSSDDLEERLRFHSQILDAVGQAVISTDLEGRITSWNRGAERLYGWTAAEAIGWLVSDLLAPPATRAAVDEALRSNLRRPTPSSGEYRMQTKAGKEIVVEAKATPILDAQGRVVGRVGVSSDIGARKEGDRRLRESEERFRAIFQESGIGIAIVDLEGRVVIANQRLGALLLQGSRALAGVSVRALSHPADWESEERQLERLLRGEIDGYALEKRYRRGDGSYVWGRLTATLVRGEHGEPLYIIGMVEDADERRRAEAALRASREELQRLYAHLQVVREMEQTRIARDLHDELGQMLTALKLDVAWLRRRAGAHGLSQEEAVERLEQTSVLVDQTLAATRRLAMHLRPVVLDDLGLEAAIEWLVEEMARHAAFAWRLHTEVEDLLPARARDTAAYRILQEALTNVARHAGATRVEVRAVHRRGELRLTIRDDGRGIPRGAGGAPASMGIAGMRERARAFGGELVVRRAPGGGTLVSARLPDPVENAE